MKVTLDFKEMIFQITTEGIQKMYGYDKETARNIVEKSGLAWSIEVAPDMIAHCSQEQLVDMVMG